MHQLKCHLELFNEPNLYALLSFRANLKIWADGHVFIGLTFPIFPPYFPHICPYTRFTFESVILTEKLSKTTSRDDQKQISTWFLISQKD